MMWLISLFVLIAIHILLVQSNPIKPQIQQKYTSFSPSSFSTQKRPFSMYVYNPLKAIPQIIQLDVGKQKLKLHEKIGEGGFGFTYIANVETDQMGGRLNNLVKSAQIKKQQKLLLEKVKKQPEINGGDLMRMALDNIVKVAKKNIVVIDHQIIQGHDTKVVVKIAKMTLDQEHEFGKKYGFPPNHERDILIKLGIFVGETVFENHHVLAMKYFPGDKLLTLLKNGKINTPQDLVLCETAAKTALNKIHELGIAHNDVSLFNVNFHYKPDGTIQAHFFDFGLSLDVAHSGYKLMSQTPLAEDELNLESIFEEAMDILSEDAI